MVDKQHGAIVALDGPLGVDGVHVIHNFTFANQAAQDGFDVQVSDVGKICHRLDIPGFFVAVAAGVGLQNWTRLDNESSNVNNVTQIAHGLVVLDVVFASGGVFAKADSSDPDKLGVGVVSEINGLDDFVFTTSGSLFETAHGLTVDALLYCNTSGKLTATRPPTGEFDNPIAYAVSANAILILPWKYERDPQQYNRLELKSPTAAAFASTTHGLQLGQSTGNHLKFGPDTIASTTVGLGAANLSVAADQFRTTTVNNALPWAVRTEQAAALADALDLGFAIESDSGAVQHATFGHQSGTGLTIQNFGTGTDKRDVTVLTVGTEAAFRSSRGIFENLGVPTTTSTTHALQIGGEGQFRLKIGGGVMLAVNASNNTGNMRYEANNQIFAALGANIYEGATVTPIKLRSTATVPLGSGYTQLIQFGSDNGAVDHAEFGMRNNIGLSLENFNTAGLSDDIRFETVEGTIYTTTTAARNFELRTLTSIPLGDDYSQFMQWRTTNQNVLSGQFGFDEANGWVWESFKTGATNGNLKMIPGSATNIVDAQAIECTGATQAFVVNSVANEAAVTNVKDGAIVYDLSASAFKFRENGAWVTGSGLA